MDTENSKREPTWRLTDKAIETVNEAAQNVSYASLDCTPEEAVRIAESCRDAVSALVAAIEFLLVVNTSSDKWTDSASMVNAKRIAESVSSIKEAVESRNA